MFMYILDNSFRAGGTIGSIIVIFMWVATQANLFNIGCIYCSAKECTLGTFLHWSYFSDNSSILHFIAQDILTQSVSGITF